MTVAVAMAPALADVVGRVGVAAPAPRASTSARELRSAGRDGPTRATVAATTNRASGDTKGFLSWGSKFGKNGRLSSEGAGIYGSQENVSNLPFLSIRCARIGGIEVPNQKRIEVSLQYIHGIGKTSARQILLDTELENRLTKELTEEDLTRLRDEVAKYMIEGDLRRFNALAIKRLRDIQCYRGRRHIMGLPCRGQHTKCNARTRKGKKVTVAGKKKAPGK